MNKTIKNIQLKTHLYLLNDWLYHHRRSPQFPVVTAQPSCTSFFLHNQLLSDPPSTLRHPTTKNLPLAQIFCGMPSAFVPPPTLHPPQPMNDGTDLFFALQKNPYKKNPEPVQPLPGLSTVLLSCLHPQAQCLHAIQKTIKQLQQHSKAEQLNCKTLPYIALQFQNDFALLRYLLFHSDGNISLDDTSVSH